MKKYVLFVFPLFILTACGTQQPSIDYENTNSTDTLSIDSVAMDTTKVLVAELPVYFDSSDYLIHPILLKYIRDNKGPGKFESGSYSGSGYSRGGSISWNTNEDDFRGNIMNLLFENLKTGRQHLLSQKVVNISYVNYLRELSWKINRQYIIYTLIDNDSNHDGVLNNGDIQSLYISSGDGTNFRKITNKYQEYVNGELILQELRFYFRTMEDVNKDGVFTEADRYHYYYIDFSGESYTVVEYDPLRLIKK